MAAIDDPSGRDVLQHLDRAIAARPARDGQALTQAVSSLAVYRDHVIVAHREDGGSRHRTTLDRVNAVMSVVLAAEFPVAEIPWEEVVKARSWLAAVVEEDQAQ